MVLCPYIFLLLRHDTPTLMLQPTEVHSAHWVSLRALFTHSLRTYRNCDVSERLNKYNNTGARYLLRLLFGQMRFSATQLMPTESLWCSSSTPDFHSAQYSPPTPLSRIIKSLLSMSAYTTTTTTTNPPPQHPPLLLWGLTLGIIADFLGPLSSGVPKFWTWPTFSSWDYRLAVWLFTYSFRAQKLRELRADGGGKNDGDIPTQLSGLDRATFCASTTSGKQKKEEGEQEMRISVVGKMLDGYFDRAMLGALLVLFFRLGLTTAFLFSCIKYAHIMILLTTIDRY